MAEEIKAGDKVRMTLGNSVIEGRVTYLSDSTVDLQIDGSADENTFAREEWGIEVINPTNQEVRDALPPGSVIRFNDEKAVWIKSVGGGWWTADGLVRMGAAMNSYTQHVIFNPDEVK